MKKTKIRYITIIVISSILSFSCKAQVTPLYKANPDLPEGTYYKDLDNDMEKFGGTWMWENGNTSFTMILDKEEHIFSESENVFHDMVVGEYQFIENGIEIINTLPRLNDASIIGHGFYLSGTAILHKNHPPLKCDDCTNDERRIKLFLYDPGTPHIPMQIILRHIVDNGIEKLQAMIIGGGSYIDSTTHPNTPRIPFGVYFTLVKQD